MKKVNDTKEHIAFKRLIKKELNKAVDVEDYERLKNLFSTLELFFQMKKKLDTSVKESEETNEKEPKIIMTETSEDAKDISEKRSKTPKDAENKIQEMKEDIKEDIIVKEETIIHEEEESTKKRRSPQNKLEKGLKTPEKAFVFPVVDTLMEFGGIAPRKEVVTRVYEKMRHILKDYDLAPMPYNKYVPRWKDTLHWVRLQLVERGIIEKGTEKGIWALTEYGKAYYSMHKNEVEVGEKKEVDIPEYSESREDISSEEKSSAEETQGENMTHNIEQGETLNQQVEVNEQTVASDDFNSNAEGQNSTY